MTRRALALLFALVLAIALAACGDDAPTAPAGGEPDADVGVDADADADDFAGDAGCLNTLTAVDSDLVLGTNSSNPLEVTYATCTGQGLDGVAIAFEIVGDAEGARLSAQQALTDVDGVAEMNLTTGDEADFEVIATGPNDEAVIFDVQVSANAVGSITVAMTYAGAADLDAFAATLYEDTPCSELTGFDRPTAFLTLPPVDLLSDRPRFATVPAGTDYTVTVHASEGGAALAFGCADEVEVLGGFNTDVRLSLTELPVIFDGEYTLDNRFDLTGSLPPSVANALLILDELTDDDDPDGDPVTEDYGIDPAAFLLDFVYRQFCCWEATSGDFDDCQAQEFTHPFGDLEQLYTQDFTSWSGAQPSVRFLCGGLETANPIAQTLVQDLINDNVPGVALRLLDIVGDLSRAFTDMNIISRLQISDVFTDKIGNFTHELVTMVVELHDLDGNINEYEFALAAAGLRNLTYSDDTTASESNVLTIPSHQFQLDMGRLLQYVFTDVLLPSLDCDPDGDGTSTPCSSLADLFATWIDCVAVGVSLEDNVGILSASSYEGFCQTGLTLAGGFVEDQIGELVDAATVVTIEGTVLAGEIDANRVATTLVDGEWDGLLEEDDTEIGAFTGTFSGDRVGDVSE